MALPLIALVFLGFFAVSIVQLGKGVGKKLTGLSIGMVAVEVSGNRYLTPGEVREAAGIGERESFFKIDMESVVQNLESHPRIRSARIDRRFNARLRIQVEERTPVALVNGTELREIDREGIILPPLVLGVVADLPLLSGLKTVSKGQIEDDNLSRALRWLDAFSIVEVGLGDRVSELDLVSKRQTEAVVAPEGTRILLPAEPSDMKSMSALRVVLGDLEQKGIKAVLIDCTAYGMVVVTPAPGSPPYHSPAASGLGSHDPKSSVATL